MLKYLLSYQSQACEREIAREKREDEWRKKEFDWKQRVEEQARKDEQNREKARERELAAMIEQKVAMRKTNEDLHAMQENKAAYAELITSVPKYDGRVAPDAFLCSLEKQLIDHGLPEKQWLGVLESTLQDRALPNYWSLVAADERYDYQSAKQALLRCMGTVVTKRLDQVGVIKRSKEDTIADICEESVQHVSSFLSHADTAADIKFKWIMTRTLAKCRSDCAEAVWKRGPKSATELVLMIREWEQQHGSKRVRVFLFLQV